VFSNLCCAARKRCKKEVVFKKEVKAMAVRYKEAQKNLKLGDFILLNEGETEEI